MAAQSLDTLAESLGPGRPQHKTRKTLLNTSVSTQDSQPLLGSQRMLVWDWLINSDQKKTETIRHHSST